ncbi:hypothetical protein FCR2A7T_17690 [Flavobacterium cauense R2A-7]|nr:hypothetical protein FCR2A7T_17690 [Flavobacterium cauense R2A-7]
MEPINKAATIKSNTFETVEIFAVVMVKGLKKGAILLPLFDV